MIRLTAAVAGILFIHASMAERTQADVDDPSARYTIVQQRPDRLLVRLPNRMLVIAQELPTAPVVSAQVWVKTGSIYEQEHVGAGLSHFLEHLISGGSTINRTEAESSALLGAIGARTNAATSLDTVRYYINTSSAHTDAAIDLLSDWMRHSIIPQAEYERERDVIQREFEHGMGDPNRILWKIIQQARFAAHPARHPTIGYLDDFLNVTREEIYRFYRRMYVPNNMVFVVVGEIDKQQVVDQIAALWADAPEGQLPELSFPIEPEIAEPRDLTGVAGINRPRLQLAWPGTRLGQEGDYALDLLSSILGYGESSRLTRTVRDELQHVFTVQAYNVSFNWGEGFFGIQAEVSPAGIEGVDDPQALVGQAVDRARASILQQVERIRTAGVNETELARAKRQTLAYVLSTGQTAEDTASRLARDTIGMGDPDYLQRYAQAIQAVTAEQVQAAAERFLTPQRLITITLLPLGEGQQLEQMTRPVDKPIEPPLPTEPVVLDNAAQIAQLQQVGAHDGERSAIEVDDVKRYVMPNGLRLLVQRSTLVPAVSMQLYQIGGLLAEQPGQQGVSNAVANMMLKGTTTRSAEQIAEAIESLGASMSTQGGNNTNYVRAVSLKEDWPAMMALLADVTLNPTFPQEEWGRLQPRLLAAIARQRDQWGGELRQHFLREWFGDNHPWSVTTLGRESVVQALQADDLRQFHAARLAASETVIAVFGDVDPEEVAAAVRDLFAAMPREARTPFEPLQPPAPQPAVHQFHTTKPMAAVQIGYGPGITRQSPDYAAMTVVGRVLSDFPSGWLEHALRGEEGLAYAVGAFNAAGLVPGYFAVVFNTNPPAVAEAVARVEALIDRLKSQPVDETTLARAKAAVLTSEFLGKQSNSDRATEAALNELYGLPMDESDRFQQAVEQLTAEDLQAAAQRYLTNPVTVVISHVPVAAAEKADAEAVTSP